MRTPGSSLSKYILVLSVVLPLAGCAGVKAGSSSTQQISIQLNQTTATLAPGGTQQFTATVSGSDNAAVTWTVDKVAGGNSTVGTITSTGLYTAPQSSGAHVVTATAVVDTTKSASATVTVKGTLAINPATATMVAGATQTFQAILNGTVTSGATWTVDGVSGGNSSVGTITGAGVYTAPSQAGTHTISASVGTGSSNSATAPVIVFSFAIAPTNATVAEGGTQQFTATIQGLSNTGVTWSVNNVVGGNATTGTISATGLYTAPAQSGTYTIGATSMADTAASVTTPVNISAPLGPVVISPTTATLMNGTSQQFTASVLGGNPTFTWSVDGVIGGNSTVGNVSNTGQNPGLYTAPSAAGNHTVTASDGTGTGNSASAQVTVWSFTISPTVATVAPGGTQQFTATIQGITNTSVTWSVDGINGGNNSVGTVSTTGLYTAPTATGAHNVTATSVAYPSDSVTARVTVVNGAQSAVLTFHNDDARDGAYLR